MRKKEKRERKKRIFGVRPYEVRSYSSENRYEYRAEPPGQGRNRQIYCGTYGICRSETGSVHQWSRR